MPPLPSTLRLSPILTIVPLLLSAGGCKGLINAFYQKPNEANIELRKQKQDLEETVTASQKQHETDQSLIQSLRQSRPTTAALAPERMAKLYTTHDLKFGSLTGGFDAGPARPGESGVKVYVVPTDQDGQPLKAAGSFKVEAFDLAQPQDPLVGQWSFSTDEAKRNWYGAFMSYTYAFTLPWKGWKRLPAHPEVTIKVTFTDELTGLSFEKQTLVKVQAPATTQPASAPSP